MKIAILGAGGRLGAALLREYRSKFDVAGFDHTQLDLSDLGAVREKLRNTSFDVLINAAGFTKVDLCETQSERAFLIDAEADKFSTPTYTLDIAAMLPRFFDANLSGGILHFANAGECSWQEYAQCAVDCCHDAGLPLKAKTIGERKLRDMTNWVARRPVYSVLSTAKYTKLTGLSPRTWREAVSDYITRFYSKK